MIGKRKRGEDAEPDTLATAATLCKIACVGEEEADSNNALNMIFPSLAAPCKHPMTKEKRVSVFVLLPSTAKDAKIDAPADESSAVMLTAQCTLPSVLVDPEKKFPHVFPDVYLVRPMVQTSNAYLSEARENV